MILRVTNSLSSPFTNQSLNKTSFPTNSPVWAPVNLKPSTGQPSKNKNIAAFAKSANSNMADKFKQTALLVIDMQNDFVLEDGLMRVNGGKAIIPNVIKTVEVARQRDILVIWVVREHDPQGRDVELYRRHYYSAGKVPPVAKGTTGAELVDGLAIKEEDYKLVKTRFSAFMNTNLHSLLQTEGIKNLVFAGVQTPNCIRQTVFDAVALDYQDVIVVVDATAAATPEIHSANIIDMKNIGVATPTLQEWCNTDD
ncbi:probable inactive nicotinamidase At3g16190 isoform X1 [Mercurialis annua]|uniref:probable inactive nicotinamidase At3g16190 isoform X1 n=1 Tax=Mercurialis annua TaxID=3986 RepID=UPI00215DF806|nr:probable inactive nicotinamidase At3g16190 isoform X1 [Mercurialis annua]